MQYENENLEKVLSLHENLLDKMRSLEGVQFDLVKLETKLKEAQQEVVNYQTLNQNLSANTNLIIVARSKAMILTFVKDLQAIEFDYKV